MNGGCVQELSVADIQRKYQWRMCTGSISGGCVKKVLVADVQRKYQWRMDVYRKYQWRMYKGSISGGCTEEISVADVYRKYHWRMCKGSISGGCIEEKLTKNIEKYNVRKPQNVTCLTHTSLQTATSARGLERRNDSLRKYYTEIRKYGIEMTVYQIVQPKRYPNSRIKIHLQFR